MKRIFTALFAGILATNLAQAGSLGFAKKRTITVAEPKKAALRSTIRPIKSTLASNSSAAKSPPYTTRKWGYQGENGPQYWANLHRDYHACSGKNQSPINLASFTESVLRPLEFNYQPQTAALLNNGLTVQLNYPQPKFMRAEKINFNLLQLRFHAPSEHQIKGQSYPLEAHFVHKNDHGDRAVVAVLFEIGDENPALSNSMTRLPMEAGHHVELDSPLSPEELLPANRDYYRYNGSMTVPPCTEGVRWYVMKTAVSISNAQLEAVKSALGQPNNRPIQSANARTVLK